MKRPFLESESEEKPNKKRLEVIDNGNGRIKGMKETIYTGNKSKDLFVHMMQKDIEIDKPIKTKIFHQSVEWNKRQWAIVPDRFIYDYNGIAHQYVDVNDVAVLTIHKDHEDNCKKCGGKMTVDAKESRALGRRGVFTAIWGLDNTHIILLIIFAIGAMGMAGAFIWALNSDTQHKAQLESAQENIKTLLLRLDVYEPNTIPDAPAESGKK